MQSEKVHPLDAQAIVDEMEEKLEATYAVSGFEYSSKSIRCLQDLLKESQSLSLTSMNSCFNDSVYDSDMEVIVQKTRAYIAPMLFLGR